jgi:hypothetical protein
LEGLNSILQVLNSILNKGICFFKRIVSLAFLSTQQVLETGEQWDDDFAGGWVSVKLKLSVARLGL